jgi:hypothetical protein
MMDIPRAGLYGRYQFEDGKIIVGWNFGELPEGLLISMDPDGNDVRLFKKRYTAWSSIEGPIASFSVSEDTVKRLRELEGSSGPAFKSAFRRLDLKPFQRFQDKSADLTRKICNFENVIERDLPISDDEKWFKQALYPTDEVLELHRDVLDELERVDIIDIMTKAGDKLANIPSRYVLPIVDAANAANEIDNDFHDWSEGRWGRWRIERHRSLLDDVSGETRTSRFMEMLYHRAKTRKKEKTSDQRGDGMRYASAILRVLGGTGLITGNIGVALAGGLTSVLTIGTTTIPTAVGVIASVGTGVSQVSDGLEKLGMLQRDIL